MKLRAIAVVGLFAASAAAFGQVPTEIVATAPDEVGGRVVFYLKDAIKGSNSLALVSDVTDSRMRVSIVTLDPEKSGRPGSSTVYAMTITWQSKGQYFPYYITTFVGTCGANVAKSCGEGLIVDIAKAAEDLGMDKEYKKK